MKTYCLAYNDVPTSWNPRVDVLLTEKDMKQQLEIKETSVSRRLRFKPPHRDKRVISEVYCIVDGQKVIHMRYGGYSLKDSISHELAELVSPAKPDILAEGM